MLVHSGTNLRGGEGGTRERFGSQSFTTDFPGNYSTGPGQIFSEPDNSWLQDVNAVPHSTGSIDSPGKEGKGALLQPRPVQRSL